MIDTLKELANEVNEIVGKMHLGQPDSNVSLPDTITRTEWEELPVVDKAKYKKISGSEYKLRWKIPNGYPPDEEVGLIVARALSQELAKRGIKTFVSPRHTWAMILRNDAIKKVARETGIWVPSVYTEPEPTEHAIPAQPPGPLIVEPPPGAPFEAWFTYFKMIGLPEEEARRRAEKQALLEVPPLIFPAPQWTPKECEDWARKQSNETLIDIISGKTKPPWGRRTGVSLKILKERKIVPRFVYSTSEIDRWLKWRNMTHAMVTETWKCPKCGYTETYTKGEVDYILQGKPLWCPKCPISRTTGQGVAMEKVKPAVIPTVEKPPTPVVPAPAPTVTPAPPAPTVAAIPKMPLWGWIAAAGVGIGGVLIALALRKK